MIGQQAWLPSPVINNTNTTNTSTIQMPHVSIKRRTVTLREPLYKSDNKVISAHTRSRPRHTAYLSFTSNKESEIAEMKQVLLLLGFIMVFACVYRSSAFHVHFDNGSDFEGRIEIQYQDDGVTIVCDGGWNRSNDTEVMCRQLSFGSAEESTNDTRDQTYYYEVGNGTIWFESVSCNGSEPALEQCSDDDLEGTHEQDPGVKCASSNNDFIPNNKTQFSCNIDFRLTSGDSEGIMDGKNTLPAASDFKAIRMVLSDHNNTTIIINNNIINAEGTPIWLILTAISGAIGAFIMLIACLYKGLQKMPGAWTKIQSWIGRTESYTPQINTRDPTEETQLPQPPNEPSPKVETTIVQPPSTDLSSALPPQRDTSGYNSQHADGEEQTDLRRPIPDTDNDT